MDFLRRTQGWVFCVVGLLWGSTAVFGGTFRTEVIYGEDGRRDIFEPGNSNEMIDLAKSTAILIRSETIKTTTDGNFELEKTTFGSSMGLCSDERFAEQPAPGHCSGFLVGADIFVTAGHCIKDTTDCAGTTMVFGFGYQESATENILIASKENVYRCKEVLATTFNGPTKTDYAVIRLDRQVVGRAPLKFRKTGLIENGTDVTVIGHPSGLPTKIAQGAAVRQSEASAPFFVANLDTYGGNSGSAVFNTQTGEVEGILVRGADDFLYDSARDCMKSNHCENGACRGEDVTRSTEFAKFVPTNPQDERP